MIALLFTCVLCTLSLHTNADCGVVTRREWNGLKPKHVEYLARPVSLVIIQHTATPSCATDAECVDIVRSIQTYHVQNLNFWDIGPSFLIGSNGKVYEGPGWIHVGAHTYTYNRRSIGISFIGNFSSDEPTQAALHAAQALIACGVKRGHLKSSYKLVGHRQLIATESPGHNLYNEIQTWPGWLEDVSSEKN